MIDLYPIPDLPRGRLAVALRPRGGDWLLSELQQLERRGWTLLVSTLEREELEELELQDLGDACAAAGLGWSRGFRRSREGLAEVPVVPGARCAR